MSQERIQRVIDKLTEEWGIPKNPRRVPSLTQCTAERADETIVDTQIPPDVVDFWNLYRRANLFIEVESQLWGLKLFGYKESIDETERFKNGPYAEYLYKDGDFVLGKFFGYPDLLIVRCDPKAADFGHVFVAIYDGKRDEWYHVENSFADFLERYADAEGETYWEKHTGEPAGKDW
jgi:hypothetical protein